MKLKLMMMTGLFLTLLNGASIEPSKQLYTAQERIIVTVGTMSGNAKDWVAIYPAGSTTEWKNVKLWAWTRGVRAGTISLGGLPAGNYEARAFFRNSFNIEARKTFRVGGGNAGATIATTKDRYLPNEQIRVSVTNMPRNNRDWVGIYPAGSSNAWGNVRSWNYTKGIENGEIVLNNLPAGNYEARVFFNNSFIVAARDTFSVQRAAGGGNATLRLNKERYVENELVYMNFNNFERNEKDWIAIYPVGSTDAVGHILDWKYTDARVNGEISLGTNIKGKAIGSLPLGEYEVRASINQRLPLRRLATFSVIEREVTSTMYQNAQELSPNWVKSARTGNILRFAGGGYAMVSSQWITPTRNLTEYWLPFDVPNRTEKTLEVDFGGGVGGHFSFGVSVNTLQGVRKMLWTSFFDHAIPNPPRAFEGKGGWLNFSPPIENQGAGHLKVNLEQYLRMVEPNNKIVSVTAYFMTGGRHKNVKLSSH